MSLYNLLDQKEKLCRDISLRIKDKEKNASLAKKFGFEYFDGVRAQGYGGYWYDGRWLKVADRLIERYNLTSQSKFLDVGCAKGFLLKDLRSKVKGISVRGLDCSEYAKSKACPSVQPLIDIGCCSSLPYLDNSFDAAVAINTVHNQDEKLCRQAIKELTRVVKNKRNIFIQVDAYNSPEERAIFEVWALTAKTYLTPHEWEVMFDDLGFCGDYFWTVIGFSQGEK